MSIAVTLLSKYDDSVWDFSKDYKAVRTQCRNTIRFVGVWERNPAMCETAKAFAWAKKKGTATQRPCGWGTVRTNIMRLSVFAQILESLGHTSFAALTIDNFDKVVASLPNARYGAKILGDIGVLYSMPNIPHIPEKDPFNGQKAHHIIRDKKVENTEAIAPDLIKYMVLRCLEYEKRLPDLMRLIKTRNWKRRFAVERGITGARSLRREWEDTQIAACILIFASTGMRCSELLSLERNCLDCTQSDGVQWYLNGTVFKFHGDGHEAKWSCTRLGRVGYRMLMELAPKNRKSLVTHFETGEVISGATVTIHLKRWMARQEWRDDHGQPITICSHQFRPTFAQEMIVSPWVNEFGLKDHFKHHDVNMTDGYVGKGTALRKRLLENHPGASKVSFEERMRKVTGI